MLESNQRLALLPLQNTTQPNRVISTRKAITYFTMLIAKAIDMHVN